MWFLIAMLGTGLGVWHAVAFDDPVSYAFASVNALLAVFWAVKHRDDR